MSKAAADELLATIEGHGEYSNCDGDSTDKRRFTTKGRSSVVHETIDKEGIDRGKWTPTIAS